jgi:hypothetical protein
MLFRTLATLRVDAPVFESLENLRWQGPRPTFEARCRAMGSPDLFGRATSTMAKALARTA